MTIPLDRLYHYIENLCHEIWPESVIIYRFFPHGSKDLTDLTYLRDTYTRQQLMVSPYIFCHDQEPLDYDRYETATKHTPAEVDFVQQIGSIKHNIRDYPIDIWDRALLLHCEQNSCELAKYEHDRFIGVYYWSHALIARDWFRYAEHVKQEKQIQKTFLIYNRAWSGTREYRLKFTEHLIRLGIQNHCKMSLNPVEPELGIHYELHKFANVAWRPSRVLEDFFPVSTADSHYSADFDIEDYSATAIEVVLETLFSDTRTHLTEKTLRPIACGQPFILAGTPGSLDYLRSYGFKTFGHIWDEQYDQATNSQHRLIVIADLMKQITNWAPEVREQKLAQAQAVADYNRQHFFSKEFFDLITQELKDGLETAFAQLASLNTSSEWLELSSRMLALSETPNIDSPMAELTGQEWELATETARNYYTKNIKRK